MLLAHEPITNADQGGTNPEAGVIATRPAIAPEHHPTTVSFFGEINSRINQVIAPIEAAMLVVTQAMTPRILAPPADPPLRPKDPSQINTVPRIM